VHRRWASSLWGWGRRRARSGSPRSRGGVPACRTVVRGGGLTLACLWWRCEADKSDFNMLTGWYVCSGTMLTGWYVCSGTMYARCTALLACIAAASAFQAPTPLGLRSRASLAPSVRQQRRCNMPQTPLCRILRVCRVVCSWKCERHVRVRRS